MRPEKYRQYHKNLGKPLSSEGSKGIIYCKDNYLEGVYLSRITPFSDEETSQRCCWHSCDNHHLSDDHDFSNKRHNQSGSYYNAKRCTKGSMPPPESVSAIVKKNYNCKVPCDLYVGSIVKINSVRENRQKYNGETGKVVAVVWPNDVTRSIIYVQIDAHRQPCFFYSELKNLVEQLFESSQATEEVQSCQ